MADLDQLLFDTKSFWATVERGNKRSSARQEIHAAKQRIEIQGVMMGMQNGKVTAQQAEKMVANIMGKKESIKSQILGAFTSTRKLEMQARNLGLKERQNNALISAQKMINAEKTARKEVSAAQQRTALNGVMMGMQKGKITPQKAEKLVSDIMGRTQKNGSKASGVSAQMQVKQMQIAEKNNSAKMKAIQQISTNKQAISDKATAQANTRIQRASLAAKSGKIDDATLSKKVQSAVKVAEKRMVTERRAGNAVEKKGAVQRLEKVYTQVLRSGACGGQSEANELQSAQPVQKPPQQARQTQQQSGINMIGPAIRPTHVMANVGSMSSGASRQGGGDLGRKPEQKAQSNTGRGHGSAQQKAQSQLTNARQAISQMRNQSNTSKQSSGAKAGR